MGFEAASATSEAARSLGELDNRVRFRLFLALERGPLRIADLARAVGLKASSIRWHLSRMEAAQLVQREPAPSRLYCLQDSPETRFASAVTLLASLPARELLAQIEQTPGRHLQELADSLHAPRSRYWRIVQDLEARQLVRTIMRHKAKLLVPTQLGITALHSVRTAGMDPRPKARRPVREFPSLQVFPRRRIRRRSSL